MFVLRKKKKLEYAANDTQFESKLTGISLCFKLLKTLAVTGAK